jgi:hypothetical protein
MDNLDTAQLAAIVAAVGVGLVLLGRTRIPLLAGFALVAVAEAGLLRGSLPHVSPKTSAAAVVAVAIGVACAWALGRRPELITPLVLATAPLRLPLDFSSHNRFLVSVAGSGQLGRLLPLYGVLGVGVLELSWRVLRGARVAPIPRYVAIPMTVFVALSCVSLTWSSSESAGANLLAYFLVPFCVLVAVVARAPFPAWMPRVLAIEAVALASLFAVVGLLEEATHRLLFFSHSLEVSNTYSTFFRVTSLFRDPSLYGRQVVLGIAILLVCLWLRLLPLAVAGALIALLFAGLYFSYSQSSLAALFAVTVGVALAVGTRSARLTMAAAVVVAAVAGAALLAVDLGETSAQKATSGRSKRVELTARVFAHHPLVGVGISAQPHASQLIATRPGPQTTFVSHTTPLTVAAELGIIGVAAFVALLAGSGRLFDLVRRINPALGLSLAAVMLALLVHSLFYSGFFEDPMAWLTIGVGAAFLAARTPGPEPVR